MSEWISIGVFAVTIVFILVATPIVAWRTARFLRIRARGELSRATSVEVEEVPVGNLDNPDVMAYRVTYAYVDHLGVRHAGRSHLLMTDPRPALEGSTAMIRFDPAEPTRSVWIGPERQRRRP
jgi:hypothetical protein